MIIASVSARGALGLRWWKSDSARYTVDRDTRRSWVIYGLFICTTRVISNPTTFRDTNTSAEWKNQPHGPYSQSRQEWCIMSCRTDQKDIHPIYT